MRQLLDLGYDNVRLYRGGIDDWKASGGPVESSPSVVRLDSAIFPQPSEPARARRGMPMAFTRRRQWGNAIVDAIDSRSTSHVFLIWLGIIVGYALLYWILSLVRVDGLRDNGNPVGSGLKGLATAIYFSLVTATSVGYGDVLPSGVLRAVAMSEAVSGLLIFGAVVAKFVSRRQDELVREIHRVTFEERLDRVQTNLHLVLSELQSIAAICEASNISYARVSARLESASLVFSGELRAVHELLYQPQRAPEEAVLGAILASLASSLRTLVELLGCLPGGFERSATLSGALRTISTIADDICAECVPNVYAPALTVWMDRIQQLARTIA